jgi:limonene-1,2-epoxide hydrolase
MSEKSETVIRTFLTSWSRGNPDEMIAFFADRAVFVDSSRGRHQGRDEIRAELATQAGAVSDVVVALEAIASTGRTVLTERLDRFTLGGVPFVIPVAGVFELDDDGHITGWRDYYDVKQFTDEVAAAGIDLSNIPETTATNGPLPVQGAGRLLHT